MSAADRLYVCTAHCTWIGPLRDALTAPHPFDETDTVVGCPACKGIDTLREKCDSPECKREASVWWRDDGAKDAPRRRACHEHREDKEARHA